MSLDNHYGESRVSRADKMSGHGKTKLKEKRRMVKLHKKLGLSTNITDSIGKFTKKFYSKKRRLFLKDPQNWDKI